MPATSGTSCWIRNGTRAGRWSRTAGCWRCPNRSTGDLFFDIEGARYYSEDGKEFGLQYLFGIVDTADLMRRAGRGTHRSGRSTGRARSGRSRS